MGLAKKNILITGTPGIGKTTLIMRIIQELKHLHSAGFYTAEIRQGGIRKGFELISLAGRRGILSHVEIKSAFRVGKYGVDVRGFEDFLEAIDFFGMECDLIVIDEIGKMECFSSKFKKLIVEALASEKLVIASIALKGGPLFEGIKKSPDAKLFEMTRSNRDSLQLEILKFIR